MGRRNKVKLQIARDVTKSGKNTYNKLARAGKSKPSSVSRSEMEPHNQRTTPSVVPAIPSDMLSLTPDSIMDEILNALPLPTRNNPTAAILTKVDSAKRLKHKGSMLYQNEKGDWVADLLPEKMAEIDAPFAPQVTGPTPTMV